MHEVGTLVLTRPPTRSRFEDAARQKLTDRPSEWPGRCVLQGMRLATRMDLVPGPPPLEDPYLSLVARVSTGDEVALKALYDATSSRVHGLALHVLRDR